MLQVDGFDAFALFDFFDQLLNLLFFLVQNGAARLGLATPLDELFDGLANERLVLWWDTQCQHERGEHVVEHSVHQALTVVPHDRRQ